MKIVIQRVLRAEVRVAGERIARIGPGLMLLVGIDASDGGERVDAAADRVLELRIFGDEERRMNRSCRDVRGDILAVPQFTLAATLERGRRPSFDKAAPAPEAETLFQRFVDRLKSSGLRGGNGPIRCRHGGGACQ